MKRILKPKAYVYPLPVLIIGTYSPDGTPNAMNAAWGTVCDTAQVSICLSATHLTTENILERKAFTVAIADDKNVISADYVGVVSGHKVIDKVSLAGWHATCGKEVDAPVFDELPLTMECKLISYDTDTEICIGEVVSVTADESILDADGKIDLTRFHPICYDCDTHGYYRLGERVGEAFSDGLKMR